MIMKTRKFISMLRVVTEVNALLFFVLLIALMIIYGDFFVQETMLRFWPIGAGVLLAYTILTFAEDYLNYRTLYRSSKLI